MHMQEKGTPPLLLTALEALQYDPPSHSGSKLRDINVIAGRRQVQHLFSCSHLALLSHYDYRLDPSSFHNAGLPVGKLLQCLDLIRIKDVSARHFTKRW